MSQASSTLTARQKGMTQFKGLPPPPVVAPSTPLPRFPAVDPVTMLSKMLAHNMSVLQAKKASEQLSSEHAVPSHYCKPWRDCVRETQLYADANTLHTLPGLRQRIAGLSEDG